MARRLPGWGALAIGVVAILPIILAELRNRGYDIVTVSELMKHEKRRGASPR